MPESSILVEHRRTAEVSTSSHSHGDSQPTKVSQRSGRLLRGAWIVLAVLSLAILLAAVPGYLSLNPLESFRGDLDFDLSPQSAAVVRVGSLVSLLSVATSLGMAGLLYAKRFDQPMGTFLSFYLLAHGTLFAGSIELLQPIWPAAPIANSFFLLPLIFTPASIALIGLFPDGRFVPRWSKWLVPLPWVYLPLLWVYKPWQSQLDFSALPSLVVRVALGVTFGAFAASVYVLVYRYRRVSTAAQRQQTKWVIFGLALSFVLQGASSIVWIQMFRLPVGAAIPPMVSFGTLIYSASTTLFPITLTIAFMRYRLYEIDTLVNRALVYGLLTGALGLTYFASVVLLQGTLRRLTGQESPIAIVASTLLVWALSQPLQRRLQELIDRRFYRRRYDAGRMLARFGSRLGDEMEVEAQSQLLLGAVEETVQPRHVSMWIKSLPKSGA